jgi:hypothetical protein
MIYRCATCGHYSRDGECANIVCTNPSLKKIDDDFVELAKLLEQFSELRIEEACTGFVPQDRCSAYGNMHITLRGIPEDLRNLQALTYRESQNTHKLNDTIRVSITGNTCRIHPVHEPMMSFLKNLPISAPFDHVDDARLHYLSVETDVSQLTDANLSKIQVDAGIMYGAIHDEELVRVFEVSQPSQTALYFPRSASTPLGYILQKYGSVKLIPVDSIEYQFYRDYFTTLGVSKYFEYKRQYSRFVDDIHRLIEMFLK